MSGFASTFCLVFGLLLFGPVPAEEGEAPGPASLEELKAAIARVVSENEVPGVGIAMVDESGPVWIGAIGKANLEKDIDADENSLFRIGSTSKMFVALSVLKLVEEAKLSLSDRLSDLAPEIEFENRWEATDPVRIVHLLEHTTGWNDIHLPEFAHSDPTPATLKEGLDFHPHSRVSRWKPGSRMAYCNAGPPIAAYVVEKVTGQEFESYVHENFFAPMGMDSMTYRLSDDVKAKGVTSYTNGNKPQEYWHILQRPSGSINASPGDMSKMVAFFVNRGEIKGKRLITENSLDRMERVESTTGAKAGLEAGYGLNNYTSSHKQWVYRGHSGGVNGGLTELAYLPEANFGHVIMMNSDDYLSFATISDLVRDFETRNLTAAAVPNAVGVTAEHTAIEGFYHPVNSRQQVAYFLERVLGVQILVFEEGRLLRRPLLGGDTTAYVAVSLLLYASQETGLVSLARVIDPLIGPVVHADSLVLKPASSLLVYGQLGIAILWGLSIVTSLFYFLVWGVRKLRGKIPSGATVRVRLWPLLAGLSVIALIGFFVLAIAEPMKNLAAPTVYSVGIMLSSIAFAVFAVVGVRTSIEERHTAMNRVNYWHSTIASFVHGTVVAYLLWFGAIGIMTWA